MKLLDNDKRVSFRNPQNKVQQIGGLYFTHKVEKD